MQQTFTSNEVIALTGITARQLQWWDERGIVVPSRQGHKRIYSLDDLAEVAILCELRQRGFSLQKIRRSSASCKRSSASGWSRPSPPPANTTC